MMWAGKIREPELLFVSHQHAQKIGERYYEPPDLVAEVINKRIHTEMEFIPIGVNPSKLYRPCFISRVDVT